MRGCRFESGTDRMLLKYKTTKQLQALLIQVEEELANNPFTIGPERRQDFKDKKKEILEILKTRRK